VIETSKISIILPAKNEEQSLSLLLPALTSAYRGAEIIVVNDGSSDGTRAVCEANDIMVINHPYSMGNGAAIKSGARHATREILVFMDADAQHEPKHISDLLAKLDEGYDMVVAARRSGSHASTGRLFANTLYNRIATAIVGHKIEDLTSGFRAVKAEKFREFLHLLPNGFSYPTTITMAFFRSGYPVTYIPITAQQRIGKSHIKPLKDGVRFLIIIFKIGTLYSPLKIYAPLAFTTFMIGLSYYAFTLITMGRLTNMSVILFVSSMLIFLIGLVSEQITGLVYQKRE